MDKIIFDSLMELDKILKTRLQLPKMVIVWCGLTTLFFYPLEDPQFSEIDDILDFVRFFATYHDSFVGCVLFDQSTKFTVDGFPENNLKEVQK